MALINRRRFINQLSLSAAFLSIPGYGLQNRTVEEYVISNTDKGKVRGIRVDGVNIYKGIPYQGKASGIHRFRRPAPVQPWTGIRDAIELGAPAIQPPRRNEPDPSEDCLFLNVWTPGNDQAKRPVMFYNHGGGYVIGSGGSGGQDGANLARNFDVVVVETNHRLGLLGFLYLDEFGGGDFSGSGNTGIQDIADGLKWVNENIAEFGGDPSNVMIFGESGGGGKTSCLYAMPGAAPFFNKASIESGPGVRMLTRDNAAETTERLFQQLNINKSNWDKILNIPADQLFEAQQTLPFVPPYMEEGKQYLGFGPVVDGNILPNHPFDPEAPDISRNKPLMVGWNEDEFMFFAWERRDTSGFGISFDELAEKFKPEYGEKANKIIETYKSAMPDASPTDIYVAVESIRMMGLGSIEMAERKAAQTGADVYLYYFGYKSEMKLPGTDYAMGTPHAMDIAFKFNNVVPGKPGFFAGERPERFQASHNMAELWTTFARTGKPAAANVPDWPSFNLEDRPGMRISENCEVLYDRYEKEINMWRSLGYISTI